MASSSRSTRQPLDWLPFEVVPDDSERGYATIQITPVRDPQTGHWTFPMHGYTPAPTPADGYHATATVDLDADRGAVVTRLVMEPSATIQEGDHHRPREPHERRLSPINTSALSLIKFTDVLNRIVEIEKGYVAHVEATGDESAIGTQTLERAASLRRRGPRKNRPDHARYAEQAIHSMKQGRGYHDRLVALYPQDWTMSKDGIKKRIARLRQDNWLHPDYGKPGSALVEWRTEHGDDHWNKESK